MTKKEDQKNALESLVHWLRRTPRVVVLTGAGVSQESGIPTFRGPGGWWRNFRPEELATPRAFAKDPRLVWEWYDWRRSLIRRAEPNVGHRALVELEKALPQFTLITQNVDGLHRRAGSRQVLEIHGSIWEVRCPGCGKVEEDHRVPIPIPPYCDACGGLLRPNVVWFGEDLDPRVLDAARQALVQAQVMLVIGTSAVVQPAASFALWAQAAGAKLAEINPAPTPLTQHCDLVLTGKSGEILPLLVRRFKGLGL
jgi:NAD-dependent deacetylase|uniref:NAD-dependent protein deacylase n=1 Tax=Desulfobacca acetoxidans TaxID=60893 RepID=A0A7C3SL77_9BACT